MARTSQALTEMPSAAAARSTRSLSCSGRRSVSRAMSPLSASHGGGAVSVGLGRRLVTTMVGLAAAQPDLDGGVVELGGDLGGRVGEHLEQAHPGGRVQRAGQQLGGAGHVVAAGRRGREIAAEAFEVRCQFHDSL